MEHKPEKKKLKKRGRKIEGSVTISGDAKLMPHIMDIVIFLTSSYKNISFLLVQISM